VELPPELLASLDAAIGEYRDGMHAKLVRLLRDRCLQLTIEEHEHALREQRRRSVAAQLHEWAQLIAAEYDNHKSCVAIRWSVV